MAKVRRAVISVSNKKGVVELAKELNTMGVELLSTGGTAKALRDAGIPVKDVSDYTGFPEMLDGRVKTLHPKVHGGLLSRRNNPKDMEEIKKHGIETIDMVVVNLYPFEETIKKEDVTPEMARGNIDIGGPCMIRASAKNCLRVASVVDPSDYNSIIEELTTNNGMTTLETRFQLAQKAFSHTAGYDRAIADYLARTSADSLQACYPEVI